MTSCLSLSAIAFLMASLAESSGACLFSLPAMADLAARADEGRLGWDCSAT